MRTRRRCLYWLSVSNVTREECILNPSSEHMLRNIVQCAISFEVYLVGRSIDTSKIHGIISAKIRVHGIDIYIVHGIEYTEYIVHGIDIYIVHGIDM